MNRKLTEGVVPDPVLRAVSNDHWTQKKQLKVNPNGSTSIEISTYVVPKGEPPICCPETRKNPTVNKPIFPSGNFVCPPEEGGCGSVWTKKGD